MLSYLTCYLICIRYFDFRYYNYCLQACFPFWSLFCFCIWITSNFCIYTNSKVVMLCLMNVYSTNHLCTYYWRTISSSKCIFIRKYFSRHTVTRDYNWYKNNNVTKDYNWYRIYQVRHSMKYFAKQNDKCTNWFWILLGLSFCYFLHKMLHILKFYLVISPVFHPWMVRISS